MPFKTNAELPKRVKVLPEKGQTIFRKAFNASFSEFGEERSIKIAWNAVKKVFEKKADRWVLKKKIQAFVKLYSGIQALDQNDIIKKIPPDILRGIKSIDPHPFFQMYSVAHEGVSVPKIEGEGYKPITWTKKAIQSIKNVIKVGVKFFQGHNETNEKITQKELGKVIHAFQEEINGKLHQIVIGYFPNKEDVINNDVCSQEATWNIIENAGKLFADTCNKITGIALENSKNAKPAFKDAKRLGFIQAFGNDLGDKSENSSGNEQPGKGAKKMSITFEDVKQGIKDLNIYPSHVFSQDDLKNDREFGTIFDKLSTLENEKNDLEKKSKELVDEMGSLKRSNNLNTAKARINKYVTEKNLPDKIKMFIEKSFDDDKESIEDLSDEGLETYIDKETKIFQRVMGNIGEEDIKLNSGDDNAVKSEDYSDPKNNEFLDE
jgi:cation transport regulator ChaB